MSNSEYTECPPDMRGIFRWYMLQHAVQGADSEAVRNLSTSLGSVRGNRYKVTVESINGFPSVVYSLSDKRFLAFQYNLEHSRGELTWTKI
jgi:hypothetical protein